MAYGLTDNLIIWKDLYFLFLCSMLQCPQCQSVLDSMGFVCSLGKCGVQSILTLAQLWAKASLRACVWPRNARPRWSWCSKSCSKSSWRKLDWCTERGGDPGTSQEGITFSPSARVYHSWVVRLVSPQKESGNICELQRWVGLVSRTGSKNGKSAIQTGVFIFYRTITSDVKNLIVISYSPSCQTGLERPSFIFGTQNKISLRPASSLTLP